jgi:hypothetical protein
MKMNKPCQGDECPNKGHDHFVFKSTLTVIRKLLVGEVETLALLGLGSFRRDVRPKLSGGQLEGSRDAFLVKVYQSLLEESVHHI